MSTSPVSPPQAETRRPEWAAIVILITDAAYGTDRAAAAGILARAWDDAAPADLVSARTGAPAEYEPGAFYKRELPLLAALCQAAPRGLQAIVVDGYVWLDANGKPGLGAHLFTHLGTRTPVVGIAKSAFAGDDWSAPVQRGESMRPLHITAAGIALRKAAELVAQMDGRHRIPTLLNAADRAARDLLAHP